MKTVFVSSTFRDMHFERDAIRDITAPVLNEEARKHHDEFDFCDLRWGINTGDLDTDEGSRKVLDVCLDEIDRCKPPMVVLLGYRYGWIPDSELIRTAAERKHLELDDLERSVTALEIEYGSLCDRAKFDNTLFYFREIEGEAPSDYLSEDEEHAQKVAALKQRIEDMTGGRIKHYTLCWNGEGFDGVKEFAEMLAEDIKEMLLQEWQKNENLTPFERERWTHELFVREKDSIFRARQTEAEELLAKIIEQPLTIIKGAVGSGKSTLLSHLAVELAKTDWTVLPFISGLTTASDTAMEIIQNTIYYIEELQNTEHFVEEKDPQTGERKSHSIDDWRNKLAEICAEFTHAGNKLMILLDAADQLMPSEERDKLYFIPTSVWENLHFVMTCTPDFPTSSRPFEVLRELTEADKQQVIDGILDRNGRELSTPVREAMVKLESSDNPLYLSLLVQRLLMMNREDFADIHSKGDGMEAIEQHQLELIKSDCPDDLDEMSAALLREAGKRINESLVARAGEYLAVSRSGWRRKDLSALLGEEWTEIDFSHFVNYMNDCFMQREDGRFDFTHKSIRAGFLKRCEDVDSINLAILDYLKSLEPEDTVRISEIIYHTIKADDKRFFVDYVVEYTPNDNKIIIKQAALDTYVKCMQDEGQWICDVLGEAQEYETKEELRYFGDFVCFYLIEEFAGTQVQLEWQLKILNCTTLFCEDLFEKTQSYACNRSLSVSYGITGTIYYHFSSFYDLNQALLYYQKSLAISEQLLVKPETTELIRITARLDLIESYIRIAEIYKTLGDTDNRYQALEYYHKALEIIRPIAKQSFSINIIKTTNYIIDAISEIIRSLDDISSQYISLHFFRVVLDIKEQIKDQYDSSHDLFSSYIQVGRTLRTIGGIDNLHHSLELIKKGWAISQQSAKKSGTSENNHDLFVSYTEMARTYEALGSTDNLYQALEFYHKSLAICQQLVDDLDTSDCKKELSATYNKIGDIYKSLSDIDSLYKALEYYKNSLDIYQKLADELNTTESKHNLVEIHLKIVSIFHDDLDGNDNLYHALKHIQQAINITKKLAEELDTESNNQDLSVCYFFAAVIHQAIGDFDNLYMALDLYQKSLNISLQLSESALTKERKEIITASINAIEQIYINLDNDENLKEKLITNCNFIAFCGHIWNNLNNSYSKISLVKSCNYIAHIFILLENNNNLHKALKYYQKALKLQRRITNALQTTKSKIELLKCYNNVATVLRALGDINNLYEALEYCEEGLSINQCINDEIYTTEIKRNLLNSYNIIGGIYMSLGYDNNLHKALELYKKELSICEQDDNSLDQAEKQCILLNIYNNIANIYQTLGGSDNLHQALELYQKGLAISQKNAEELDTVKSKRDIFISYNNFAELLEKLGGTDNIHQALELYQKGFDISKHLDKMLDTTESKYYLGMSYSKMAGVFQALGNTDNLHMAIEYNQKAIDIREKLVKEIGTSKCKHDLSISYSHIASIYEALGGIENLNQALMYYLMNASICENYAKDYGTFNDNCALYSCYKRIALIYLSLDQKENLYFALQYYLKTLDILEYLDFVYNNIETNHMIPEILERIADVYKAFDEIENLQNAIDYYSKSLLLYKKLLKNDSQNMDIHDNIGIIRKLSSITSNLGIIYQGIGKSIFLKKAIEMFTYSANLDETIESKEPTPQSKKNLLENYNHLANIYAQFSLKKSKQTALNYYEKALRINEFMVDIDNSTDNKKALAINYAKVAELYIWLGGKTNRNKALELYQKELVLREQLVKEVGTVNDYDGLINVLYFVGKHRSVDKEKRLALLTRSLELTDNMYQQTNDTAYQDSAKTINWQIMKVKWSLFWHRLLSHNYKRIPIIAHGHSPVTVRGWLFCDRLLFLFFS